MSNQNFDTNSSLPSSSPPIPIAKQLEAQAYLSQVQNQRKDIADKEDDASLSQLPDRFSAPPAPIEELPQRANKMDSFFRQAEEDERQRVLEAENPTMQAPEQTIEESSLEPADDSQPIQQDETPVVELPQVELPEVVMTPEAEATQPEMAAPIQTEDQTEDAAFTPTPQEHSPFSTGSFAADPYGQNPNSDPQSQFSTQQDAPVEATSPSPLYADDQPPSQQPPESQAQFESLETLETPEAAASHDSTDEPESRRLTGAAGLSAGLALAGMGAFGAMKTGGPASEINDPVQSQPNTQPPAMGDPLETLRQQLAQDEGQAQSGGATTMDPVNDGNDNVAPAPNDASVSNSNTPFDQTQSDFDGGGSAQSPWTQQDVSAQNGPFEDTSSSPQQIPPAVTGGFSGGFNPVVQDPAASSVAENQVQQPSIDFDPQGNPESNPADPRDVDQSDANPSNIPSTEPQVAAEQNPPTESSATIQEGDDEVEDMRLAAAQQAQRIKAERAKALVDGPDESARPYGADRQGQTSADHQLSVLESLARPEADNVQMENPQQQPPMQMAAVTSQPSQTPLGNSMGEGGNEDSSSQHRPFPMELFNQQLLRNLSSGVVFVDHKRRVQLWSKGAEAMTGIVSDAVIERPLYPQTFNLRFEDGTGVPLDKCPIVQCLETMKNVTADYRTLNSENQEVKIEVAIAPVIDEDRCVNGAIIIFNDHSAEIDLQRQLKDLYEFSVLDPLTQVANRAEFERVLEEYVRAFNQSESFNCSIIICDIDFFKSINDNFGHAVGDQALVAFCEMLRKYVRAQDLVARYGGEEFVILCADCDTDAALQRAEQIRIGLFKTPQKMLNGKSISASFGVSELRSGDTAMEFFVRADTALLKAKELGRNRVVIADQREANRNVNITADGSVSGMQWRQQRREHTALISEEFKTSTPVPVLVEKLRGFIVEKDAWLQRVDQEFLSMEVDFEAPNDYSRKGSFTMNIEFKECEDNEGGRVSKHTFIRVTIFPGRKKKWFSTNHTDVAPHLLSDLRSYLMITDEASHLSIKMATEDVRAN